MKGPNLSDSPTFDYTEFDTLLSHNGPVAIVGQQLLRVAAISPNDVVFPPSYANPSEKKDDPPVYNIDQLSPSDPSKNVCVLDSIPSQANRMEPLFRSPDFASLVPQYSVKLVEDAPPISILDIGHRLADAVFRGTELREGIVTAFKDYGNGNAAAIARIGPTSLVFGVWDSRGTGVKVPRLINSIVRAFNVSPLKRSAQYVPPIKYEQEGLIPDGLTGKPADHGLADVPSTHKIGGVQINGEIRCDLSLNLSVLRGLKGANDVETISLQRYILGLALTALTATPESTLRQGCQLLPNGKLKWKQFLADGEEADWDPANLKIADLAPAAARDFGVVQPQDQPLVFDPNRLKASIEADSEKKADRKTSADPVGDLRGLVEKLAPLTSDKFSEAKTSPLTKLRDRVTSIKQDESSPEKLKTLATELEPLLKADAGAAERKTQILALFAIEPDAQQTDEAGVSSDANAGDHQ